PTLRVFLVRGKAHSIRRSQANEFLNRLNPRSSQIRWARPTTGQAAKRTLVLKSNCTIAAATPTKMQRLPVVSHILPDAKAALFDRARTRLLHMFLSSTEFQQRYSPAQ